MRLRQVAVLAALLALLAILSLPAQADEARGTAGPLPDTLWANMQGVSWHTDLACPARDELRLLRVPFHDFGGTRREGELILAADVAEDVLDIFAEIYRSGFRIEQMHPVSRYGGDDDRSMAANNTSAFNCRTTTGGTRLSEHAHGRAIDINPVQNPYVSGSLTLPPPGILYDAAEERGPGQPGVITTDGQVVAAFRAMGWAWGGDWTSPKDYQHFSLTGR